VKGYIRYVSAAIRTAAQEISWWNPAGGTANHDVDPTVADVSFKEMQLETQEKWRKMEMMKRLQIRAIFVSMIFMDFR